MHARTTGRRSLHNLTDRYSSNMQNGIAKKILILFWITKKCRLVKYKKKTFSAEVTLVYRQPTLNGPFVSDGLTRHKKRNESQFGV